MPLNTTFGTNKELEIEGVDIPVDVDDDGKPIIFKLARMSKSNKAYTKRLDIAFRPHQAAMQNDTLPEALASNIMRGVFIDTILKGWTNVSKAELTDDPADKGVMLEFTRENAVALFEKLPDLQSSLEVMARKSASFRDAERDENAKN